MRVLLLPLPLPVPLNAGRGWEGCRAVRCSSPGGGCLSPGVAAKEPPAHCHQPRSGGGAGGRGRKKKGARKEAAGDAGGFIRGPTGKESSRCLPLACRASGGGWCLCRCCKFTPCHRGSGLNRPLRLAETVSSRSVNNP